MAAVLGTLATTVLHYLWNVHLDGRAGLPSTTPALLAWCAVAAIGALAPPLRDRLARRERAPEAAEPDGPAPGGPRPRLVSSRVVLLLFLAPLPAVARCAAPNAVVADGRIRFAMDEFTHLDLVRGLLEPGWPTMGPMHGYDFPPYQFGIYSLQAALLRLAPPVDPTWLWARPLPLLLVGLAVASCFPLLRRLTGSVTGGALGSLALVYAGDYVRLWGMVDELHNALAHASLAVGLLLVDVAVRRRCRAAAALAVLPLGALFQLKTPVFFSAGAGIAVLAAVAALRRRDPLPFAVGLGMTALGGVLAIGHLGSVTGHTLHLAPGAAIAQLLAGVAGETPGLSLDLASIPRSLALVVGLPLIVAVALNTRLLGAGWAWRRLSDGPPPGPGAAALLGAVAAGCAVTGLIQDPTEDGGILPLFFLTMPLDLLGQAIFGAGVAAWLTSRPPARRWPALALLLLPLAPLPLVAGVRGEHDPTTFPANQYHCGQWLYRNTELGATVIHRTYHEGLPFFSLRGSVLADHPVFDRDHDTSIAPQEMVREIFAEVDRRRADLDRFFSTRDPGEALSIARSHGATLLYLDAGESVDFDLEAAGAEHLTVCGDGARVYRLPPGAGGPGRDAGPETP